MAVKEIVERRASLRKHQNPAQLIAYTAHDLMTPLTGVQLSLSLLKGDEEVKERLGGHQQELLSTAANCSDLMIRICQTAIDTLRDELSATEPDVSAATTTLGSTPVTKVNELIKNIIMIMDPIPKTVPMVVTVDPEVPLTVMSDDLKLFRSALNLTSNGLGRTSRGVVHLRISVGKSETSRLVLFECRDTGHDVPVEEYQYLFRPRRTMDGDLRLGLSSVATMINSLDGKYGFEPLGASEDGKPSAASASNCTQKGALFWFSVPLYTPENFGVNADDELPVSVIRRIASSTNVGKESPLKQPIIPVLPKPSSGSFSTGLDPDARLRRSPQGVGARSSASCNIPMGNRSGRTSSGHSVSSAGNRRIPVVVGDPMQSEAISNGCFRDVFGPITGDSKPPAVPASVPVSRLSSGPLPPTSLKPSPRKRCALVIEDSLVVRKSLARALEKLGLSVTQAVNGLEGLKRMKSKIFDLVLCDFLMPVMDGLDCVKQYRDWEKQYRPDLRQYIVGISAHGGANDGNRGIKAGMNDFRPKPVSIKILKEIQKENEATDLSRRLDEIGQVNSGLQSNSSSVASLSGAEQPAQVQKHPSLFVGAGCSTKREPPNNLSAQHNTQFDVLQTSGKRQKLEQGFVLSADQGAPVCLLATDTPTQQPCEVLTQLEREGWKVIVVHDGQDALRLLKLRNWNAVLIDDDLPVSGGAECAKGFRVWEQHNRVNRQRNVYMVCKVPIPSIFDKSSIVQPPTGFDGVLGTPVEWEQLNHMLRMKKDRSLDIIVGGHL